MTFSPFDFDDMRDWLSRISGSREIRKARLILFDSYRYREDYESLYNFITLMGAEINGNY